MSSQRNTSHHQRDTFDIAVRLANTAYFSPYSINPLSASARQAQVLTRMALNSFCRLDAEGGPVMTALSSIDPVALISLSARALKELNLCGGGKIEQAKGDEAWALMMADWSLSAIAAHLGSSEACISELLAVPHAYYVELDDCYRELASGTDQRA